MKTINLYGEIGPGTNDLAMLQEKLKWLQPDEELHLRINSPGGSVIEGFAIANFLDRLQNKIIVHIDGWAASMASIICMVGDEIHAPINAWFMIHNPWATVGGDAEEMRKVATMLDEMKRQSVDMYMRCGGKKKTRKEIEEMMDAETWMTATEAADIGFVTHLEAAAELAACWDVNKQSSKAPAAALAAIEPKKESAMPTFLEWLKSCPITGGAEAGMKELAGAELQAAHKVALDEAQAKVAAAQNEAATLKSQVLDAEKKLQEAAAEAAKQIAAVEAAKADLQARHDKLMGGHNKPIDSAKVAINKHPATQHYLGLVEQLTKEMGDVEAATAAAVKKYSTEFAAMVAEHPVKSSK
jgi:ATP-dependent protease ClpP protease subunit